MLIIAIVTLSEKLSLQGQSKCTYEKSVFQTMTQSDPQKEAVGSLNLNFGEMDQYLHY